MTETSRPQAELSKLPIGDGGWVALVDHALALGDLSEVTWLELKSALPFADRTEKKNSAVILARSVIGLANRMPDEAAKHVGGHGVLLIGIKDGELDPAERVDGADLGNALEPYLGTDGPAWEYRYVDHRGSLVLAIIVNPPAYGDPIHTCRRAYSSNRSKLTVRDGDVFVRRPGKTDLATAADIRLLEARREKSPSRGASVEVKYDSSFDHVDGDSLAEVIEASINAMAAKLLADLREKPTNSLYASIESSLASVRYDRRSPEEFRSEVEAWTKESLGRTARAADEAMRMELARGTFRIENQSKQYLESVRVEIQFPLRSRVLMASDADGHHHGGFRLERLLPDLPKKFGAPASLIDLPRHSSVLIPSANVRTSVTDTANGPLVTWNLGDLRPDTTESLNERFAVVSLEHGDEPMPITWKVTARGVDHVFIGSASLQCAQEPGRALTFKRPH